MGGTISSKSTDPPHKDGHEIDFIHRDSRHRFHTLKDLGTLRSAALFASAIDFPAAVLRSRLAHSLSHAKLADGTRLDAILSFDDQQLGDRLLLQSLWLVEHQRWDEVGDALRFGHQSGFCELPVMITQQDLQKHRSKQAYLSRPRVVAQWLMVGRHVDLGGELGRLELFERPGGELRMLKDEPAFAIKLSLPPAHRFQPHVDPEDPPLRHGLSYDDESRSWVGMTGQRSVVELSFSTFIKTTIMCPREDMMTKCEYEDYILHVRGGWINRTFTRPPRQPVEGCTVMAWECLVDDDKSSDDDAGEEEASKPLEVASGELHSDYLNEVKGRLEAQLTHQMRAASGSQCAAAAAAGAAGVNGGGPTEPTQPVDESPGGVGRPPVGAPSSHDPSQGRAIEGRRESDSPEVGQRWLALLDDVSSIDSESTDSDDIPHMHEARHLDTDVRQRSVDHHQGHKDVGRSREAERDSGELPHLPRQDVGAPPHTFPAPQPQGTSDQQQPNRLEASGGEELDSDPDDYTSRWHRGQRSDRAAAMGNQADEISPAASSALKNKVLASNLLGILARANDMVRPATRSDQQQPNRGLEASGGEELDSDPDDYMSRWHRGQRSDRAAAVGIIARCTSTRGNGKAPMGGEGKSKPAQGTSTEDIAIPATGRPSQLHPPRSPSGGHPERGVGQREGRGEPSDDRPRSSRVSPTVSPAIHPPLPPDLDAHQVATGSSGGSGSSVGTGTDGALPDNGPSCRQVDHPLLPHDDNNDEAHEAAESDSADDDSRGFQFRPLEGNAVSESEDDAEDARRIRQCIRVEASMRRFHPQALNDRLRTERMQNQQIQLHGHVKRFIANYHNKLNDSSKSGSDSGASSSAGGRGRDGEGKETKTSQKEQAASEEGRQYTEDLRQLMDRIMVEQEDSELIKIICQEAADHITDQHCEMDVAIQAATSFMGVRIREARERAEQNWNRIVDAHLRGAIHCLSGDSLDMFMRATGNTTAAADEESSRKEVEAWAVDALKNKGEGWVGKNEVPFDSPNVEARKVLLGLIKLIINKMLILDFQDQSRACAGGGERSLQLADSSHMGDDPNPPAADHSSDDDSEGGLDAPVRHCNIEMSTSHTLIARMQHELEDKRTRLGRIEQLLPAMLTELSDLRAQRDYIDHRIQSITAQIADSRAAEDILSNDIALLRDRIALAPGLEEGQGMQRMGRAILPRPATPLHQDVVSTPVEDDNADAFRESLEAALPPEVVLGLDSDHPAPPPPFPSRPHPYTHGRADAIDEEVDTFRESLEAELPPEVVLGLDIDQDEGRPQPAPIVDRPMRHPDAMGEESDQESDDSGSQEDSEEDSEGDEEGDDDYEGVEPEGYQERVLVLTSYTDDFMAWISLSVYDDEYVCIEVCTSERAVAGVGGDAPFKRRFPLTTARARRVLGPIAAIIFDDEDPEEDEDDDGDDSHGTGSGGGAGQGAAVVGA
ncbi:unnamed protein product [Vitrella brassicaformis CCMP3155]|uniref:Uncharacterized protein n=2 Tax=Vitrella brassicaformis TaxID=1169539 RepID=A0A0G4EI81_VITBC|nr:unnamed protein product [Vitrella brassicaformis CCMP3155]|eukprot:CEL95586.1 unnamed protein product [Vitrella brassicaformis CCMP3155]